MKKNEAYNINSSMELGTEVYWEDIYQTKKSTEVGWFQAKPVVSLELIKNANLPLNGRIIDVGGGDSLLVDYLLVLGYKDISVLDISNSALERAKVRLGELSDKVNWIHADITNFEPQRSYDLWHDRACFHFLTEKQATKKYVSACSRGLGKGGTFVLGTFSKSGPVKCSGLTISQCDKLEIKGHFGSNFMLEECFPSTHITPSQMEQNYTFCVLKRKP